MFKQGDDMEILQSLLGLITLTAFAWVVSENRRFDTIGSALRIAGAGLAVQLVLTLILLKLPGTQQVFLWLNDGVLALQDATKAGTTFVFGYLGGGSLPFEEPYPGSAFVLAFQALPLILVTSALSALLFHWRVLPVIVNFLSMVLQKTMGVGGAVGVSAAANVFVGMIEAPLFVRPYLQKLSRAELFMVMTCGMATIAGTVMVLYASFLADVIPGAMGHILSASLISAPAAIMVAKLMVPNTEDNTEAEITAPSPAHSSMDAITRGTLDGVGLLINVMAMLIVLIAMVSLVNAILGLLPDVADAPLALERMLGWIMAPVVWLMGVPWTEAPVAGALMGTKTVFNELIAYLQLKALPADALSERSKLIMTYAMCGFANFGSLGIMLGGITTMVPERRSEIVELGLKSIVSGTIATCITGCFVGILM